MKKIITTSIILVLVLSGTMEAKDRTEGFNSTAVAMITSLQQSCSEKYVSLFPSLKELRQRANANSKTYGLNHKEAMEAYAKSYSQDLLAVRNSFNELIQDGKNNGIDWRAVRFISYEYVPCTGKQNVGTFSILFSSEGRLLRIQIEKAIVVNGNLRVSHHISLVS